MYSWILCEKMIEVGLCQFPSSSKHFHPAFYPFLEAFNSNFKDKQLHLAFNIFELIWSCLSNLHHVCAIPFHPKYVKWVCDRTMSWFSKRPFSYKGLILKLEFECKSQIRKNFFQFMWWFIMVVLLFLVNSDEVYRVMDWWGWGVDDVFCMLMEGDA